MTKAAETFSPHDSADYLVDVETAAAYLEAALDEESRRALQSSICGQQPRLRDHHEGLQGSRAQAPLRLRRLMAATASGPQEVRKPRSASAPP